MELVYYWKEKYRDIPEIEISFEKEFAIKKIGNKLHVAQKTHVLPSGFFGNDKISVNAIIGDNGSGKSTALRHISQFLGNVTTRSVFAVLDDSSRMTIYFSKRLNIDIPVSDYYDVKDYDDPDENISINDIINLPKIYFNPVFNLKSNWEGTNCVDISSGYLLRNFLNEKNNEIKGNVFDSFLASEFDEQVKLVREKKNNFRFDFEERLKSIGFLYEIAGSEGLFHPFTYIPDFKIYSTLNSEIKSFYNIQTLQRVDIKNINIGKVILILFLINEKLNYCRKNLLLTEEYSEQWYTEILDLKGLSKVVDIVDFLKFLENKIDKISPHLIFNKKDKNDSLEQSNFSVKNPDLMMIGFVLKEFNEQNFSINTNNYFNFTLTHQLELMQFEVRIDLADNFLWILRYLNSRFRANIKSENVPFGNPSVFKYYWYLSSGEMALFTLYSRLIRAVTHHEIFTNPSIATNSDNVWICLDEAETTLSPEWQRRFLCQFLKFLPILFENKKIQVFIATHSPIILSDIPRCNVAFLEKSGEKDLIPETFGANIHTLYSKGFFVKSLVGDFAKNKIKDIIEKLNDFHEQDIETLQKHIDLIGEPILKNQLQKMLRNKQLSEVYSLKQQMKEIEERLKRLEGGAND